jgi:hypothetical protein
MSKKVKLNEYILSPRLSVLRMLEDFLKKNYDLPMSALNGEIREVEETLQKYQLFREKSREQKKEVKEQKMIKRKPANRSSKVSE